MDVRSASRLPYPSGRTGENGPLKVTTVPRFQRLSAARVPRRGIVTTLRPIHGSPPVAALTSFDGATGAVSLGDPALLQPSRVSVEAWVNTTATPNAVNTIVRKRLYGYDLYLNQNGRPAFFTFDRNAAQYLVTGPLSVADGQWHHLVGTYDGGQVCLYVDSQLIACRVAGAIFYGAGAVAIGRDGDCGCSYFTGRIADVAIFGAALSAVQVQAHYVTPVGAPAARS
jgi:hypothetical protein